jgi:hypothetical protein
MANVRYTLKQGTEDVTGVTTNSWFDIMNERNSLKINVIEPSQPIAEISDVVDSNADDLLYNDLALLKTYTLQLQLQIDALKVEDVEKLVYTISGATGSTIYNITEAYDRVYLLDNIESDNVEVVLPYLEYFKDNQKLTFVSHPDSVFRSKISWYDDNGTKNYLTSTISKDNSLEFNYWESVGNLVIRGIYTGYTFDENYYVGLKDDSLGYSIAKYDKTNTLVWSINPSGTGMTNNIKSDIYGNRYAIVKIDDVGINSRILKINPTGGTVWTGVRVLYNITSLAVTKSGVLYCAGIGNQPGTGGTFNIETVSTTGIRTNQQFYPGSVRDIALSNDESLLYVVGAPTGYTGNPNSLKVYNAINLGLLGEIDINTLNNITNIAVLSNNNLVIPGEIVQPDGTSVASYNFGYTVNDIVADKNGNFFVCGNNFIKKYDSSGNELWVAEHGAELRQMSLDANGDVYAVGDINSTYIGRVFASSNGAILANIPGSGVNATAIHVK